MKQTLRKKNRGGEEEGHEKRAAGVSSFARRDAGQKIKSRERSSEALKSKVLNGLY